VKGARYMLNYDLKQNYGVTEYNPIPKGYHDEDCMYISFADLLAMIVSKEYRITAERLRFVTDSGFPFWELSYFHVRIDGERYEIMDCPFYKVLKHGGLNKNLYKILKSCNVYIPKFFDVISTLD
jgi:hypothetical protein